MFAYLDDWPPASWMRRWPHSGPTPRRSARTIRPSRGSRAEEPPNGKGGCRTPAANTWPPSTARCRAGTPCTWESRGWLKSTGDLDAAIDAFDHAVRLSPNDPVLRREFAGAFVAAGRFEDAFAEFVAALLIAPDDADVLAAVGQMFLDADRAEEAIAPLRRALAVKADRDATHYALAVALVARGPDRRGRTRVRAVRASEPAGAGGPPARHDRSGGAGRGEAVTRVLAAALTLAAAASVISGADAQLPQFVDATRDAGIAFQHVNGASPDKHLVETMGSGGLFFDYDGDGWIDVFLVDGGSLADPAVAQAGATPSVPQPRQRDLRGRDRSIGHPPLGVRHGRVRRRLRRRRRR